MDEGRVSVALPLYGESADQRAGYRKARAAYAPRRAREFFRLPDDGVNTFLERAEIDDFALSHSLRFCTKSTDDL